MRSADNADATAAALQRIRDHGSDMSRPMAIDFFVAVPSKEAGDSVARRADALGFRTSVEQDSQTHDWTCYCTKTLVPELSAVIAIERELDEIGRLYGGHADGFGSFGNAVND